MSDFVHYLRGRKTLFRRIGVFFVLLLLALTAGCKDDEADKKDSAVFPGRAAETAGEKPGVYPLTLPGEEPSAQEKEQAEAVVDFANDAGMVIVDGVCGGYPMLIMREVSEYRTDFTAGAIAGDRPEDGCAGKSVPVPQEAVFGQDAAALAEDIRTMDTSRGRMMAAYDDLRRYVQDKSVMDEGKKGTALSSSIESEFERFRKAREHFIGIMNERAEKAQNILLRVHPLRAQVVLARRLFEDFRLAGDTIGASEPDSTVMENILKHTNEDLVRAENLPFPVAGEVEMSYRQYLKSVRELEAVFRRGLTESYYAPVREAINQSWQQSRKRYNEFIDAAGSLVVNRK